jgi:hypothetical protein
MTTQLTIQPGDFCCLPALPPGAGRLTRFAEKLNGTAFDDYRHAEIYVGNSLPEFAPGLKTVFRGNMVDLYNAPQPLPQRVTSRYGWVVSAHPEGARIIELGRPPSQLPGALWSSGAITLTDEQRNGIVAAAMKYQKVGYSWLDQLALALHRGRFKDPALRRHIASPGGMTPAKLIDQCYADAGVSLFDDKRWQGCVTPGDLAMWIKERRVIK